MCVYLGGGGRFLIQPHMLAFFLISRIGWVYYGGGIGGGRSQGAINGPRKYISYVIIVYRSSFIGKFILKNPASQIDFKYIEKTSKNFKKKILSVRAAGMCVPFSKLNVTMSMTCPSLHPSMESQNQE